MIDDIAIPHNMVHRIQEMILWMNENADGPYRFSNNRLYADDNDIMILRVIFGF